MVRLPLRKGSGRIALISLLLLAIIPSAAQGFSKAIWGDVSHDGVNQFPLYHQLGVSIFEMDLNWATTAPKRPTDPTNPNDPAYRWPPEIQQALTQANRFHIRVLLQSRSTGPGELDHRRLTTIAPLEPDLWARLDPCLR